MKKFITIVVLLFAFQMSAQHIIKHVASPNNTQGHITTINSPHTNGKNNAILIVTQNYGAYNVNEIGVWYAAGKWKIFNQNRKPIPKNSKFNVMVVQPNSGKAFVHTTAATNTAGHITTLASRLTNAKPNALVFVTQNYGKYNTSNVGVWYSGGKWKIFNENTKQKMPVGTKFNVLVLNPGENKIGSTALYAFKYTNTSSGHISEMNAPVTLPRTSTLFATQNWKNVYNPNITGVWYNGKKWTTYNQNRKAMPKGVRFNVLTTSHTGTSTTSNSNNTPYSPILVNHNILKNVGLIKVKPIASANAKDTDRIGPDAKLAVSFSTVSQMDILKETFNFYDEIYKDQNPKSGVYYYLPKQFTLKWNKEANDYAFNVFYMSSDDNKRGSVLLNIELTPNIKSEDIDLAEKMLTQQLGKKITLLPLDLRDAPEVDFGGLLSRFNIEPASVSTNIPSDYKQPIVLDWRMDSNIDNFVGAMLNQSVGAMMHFKPYGDSTSVKSVGINLKVNTFDTFGKIKFDTASELLEGWTNYLDYPMYPNKITVLKKNGARLYFETIDLERSKVEPGAIFKVNSDPSVFNKLSKSPLFGVWLNYEVDEDCEACNQTVKRKIIGGTSGSEIANMEVQVINALEYSGANSMKLLIKSIQADPNGLNEIELDPMSITEDGLTLDGIQFFVPEGKELLYKYQLILVMNDGDVHRSKWHDSNSNLLALGEKQIDRLFPDKKKNDLLNNAKDSAIEKIKDSVGIHNEEDAVNKAVELLGGLLTKKKDSTKTEDKGGENEQEQEDPNNDQY
ncbi:hypothetical protein [Maribacter sp. MAR_2009_72]|uniref:DUF7452 domain-containing protein n=1 Tax=Maribacter sp. MAR_2009_72 TaxID=1250050 RepID=UPI001199E5A4|nr:hypothetical protein [Maribacter sp. MAR_2009_72]TVZ14873.1 hypothetical protein JM81_1086 [Maribacter sp. MAR_2009_72]